MIHGKIYTDEELQELINKGEGDGKMEYREFSCDRETELSFYSEITNNIEQVEEVRNFSSAQLNLRSIIAYMSMDLRSQFRFLLLSVKKYVKSVKDPESAKTVITYLSSELARMITLAKKEILEGKGSNLNQVLGLNKVGSGEINQISMQLTRLMLRSDAALKKSGVVPKNIGANLSQLYTKLIESIIEKLGIKKIIEGGNSDITSTPLENKADQLTTRLSMQSILDELDELEKEVEEGEDEEDGEITIRRIETSESSDNPGVVEITKTEITKPIEGEQEGDEDGPVISDEEHITDFILEDVSHEDIAELEDFFENDLDVGRYGMDYDGDVLKLTFYDKLDDEVIEQFKDFVENR